MIKYYKVNNAVMRGDNITKINKSFKNRNEAISYMLNYYNKRFINAEVEEEIYLNKHVVEYICTNNNRFIVSRIIA